MFVSTGRRVKFDSFYVGTLMGTILPRYNTTETYKNCVKIRIEIALDIYLHHSLFTDDQVVITQDRDYTKKH